LNSAAKSAGAKTISAGPEVVFGYPIAIPGYTKL
jgi:hypothetical protein